MAANLLITIIGLIICFGGIYIKRFCSALIGFIWGTLAAFLIALATVGIFEIDEEVVIFAGICGVAFALISAIFNKLCVAINTFLSFFSILFLLFYILDLALGVLMYIIASLIAAVFALIAVKIYNYSFVGITAFTGAFIATCGGYGLLYETEIIDVAKRVIFNEEARFIILICSFVLGLIGVFVQALRFNVIKNKKRERVNIDKIKQINFQLLFEKIERSFIVKTLKKYWFFYLITILFVCSDLYLLNGVLYYEIMYLAIASAVFMLFNAKGKQFALWISPLAIILLIKVVRFFLGEINIYLAVNLICDILTAEGIVVLVSLFIKLIIIIAESSKKKLNFKTRSIVLFSSVFISFLIIYYSLHFRNSFVPTGHFWSGISIYQSIFLSIEAIVAYSIFYIVTEINNSKEDAWCILKETARKIVPTIVLFVVCYVSVFTINIIADKIEDSKFKTKYECYNEIISIYTQAATQGVNSFYDQQDYYSTIISDMLVMEYYNYGAHIAYALYDIDDNGTKEFIVSNGENIYDIYTVHNNQCVNLFPDETFGYSTDEWVLVYYRYYDKHGWVYKDYLKPVKDADIVESNDGSVTVDNVMYRLAGACPIEAEVSADVGLVLRNAPNTEGRWILRMEYGDKLLDIAPCDDYPEWSYVEYDDGITIHKGFAYNEYIS